MDPPLPRYIMIGGFLGAGKTTAISRFGASLEKSGRRVGLITNDQGAGLVDSAIGRSGRFPVEEIAGGCFCCRFNSLVDAARHLRESSRPDVFLAEPVGSCTDLVATVTLPLRKLYGGDYAIAPLSVLVDPVRALRVLELEEGKRFSENVRYIYLKQLEEAEVIVINKSDLLDARRADILERELKSRFPHARIFRVSARDGIGLEDWFQFVLESEIDVPRFMEVDYQRYGEGEALLGWLNATVEIHSDREFDGNALLADLAGRLKRLLADADAEAAHLKMTLSPLHDAFDIGAVNLVRGDSEPEVSHRLADPLEDGELLLNLRAEAPPETLESSVRAAFEAVFAAGAGLSCSVTHIEHFRPSQPQPTHRLAAV